MSRVMLPGRTFVGNLLALYGVQIANLLLPLVTLPYLTRVLGPGAWGELGAVQALSNVLVLVVEYGFLLSATRAVARHRAHPEQIARVAAGVLGAKLLLAMVLFIVAAALLLGFEVLRQNRALFLSGVAFAVVQGFSPLWYFQGVERLRGAAALDVAVRALGVMSIFAFVRAPEHASRVLTLQAAFYLLSVIANSVVMYREIPLRRPTWALALLSLREGWTLFLVRGAVTLYTTVNAFILRLFVPAASVANYVNADRLTSAGKGMLVPVSQLLFPRIANVIGHDQARARALMWQSMFMMLGVAFVGCTVTVTAAPLIVRVLFGPGYEASVPLLRVLILTLPFSAISNVLGVQWLLPLGLDKVFNTIIMSAGGLNILLALVLARQYGSVGVVVSALLSESFVMLAMLAYLWRHNDTPFRRLNSRA